MPKKEFPREFQLSNDAINSIKANEPSLQHRVINRYFAKNKKPGIGAGGSIASHILNQFPVTRSAAELFIQFLNDHPKYASGLKRNQIDISTLGMFSQVEAHKPPSMPTEKNDPSMRGIGFLGSTIAEKALSYVADRHHLNLHPNAVVKTGEGELLEYTQNVNIANGYFLANRNKNLPLEKAQEIAVDFFREPSNLWVEEGRRVLQINRNCIRYTLSETNKRIASSFVFPISDEAYAATIEGQRPIFGYNDDDILPTSNNIVFQHYGELPVEKRLFMGLFDRMKIQASILTQIAALLDPVNRRPVRFISYGIVEANTRRLSRLGFRSIKDQAGNDRIFPYKYNHCIPTKVMEFDLETRRTSNERKANYSMRLFDKAIWLLRDCMDEDI